MSVPHGHYLYLNVSPAYHPYTPASLVLQDYHPAKDKHCKILNCRSISPSEQSLFLQPIPSNGSFYYRTRNIWIAVLIIWIPFKFAKFQRLQCLNVKLNTFMHLASPSFPKVLYIHVLLLFFQPKWNPDFSFSFCFIGAQMTKHRTSRSQRILSSSSSFLGE